MAREPQVTRTIVTTTAKVKCADLSTNQVVEKEFTLPRTYKDNAHLMKALTAYNTEDVHIIAVVSTTENETLYGMTEREFIANAHVLPERVSKLSSKE